MGKKRVSTLEEESRRRVKGRFGPAYQNILRHGPTKLEALIMLSGLSVNVYDRIATAQTLAEIHKIVGDL